MTDNEDYGNLEGQNTPANTETHTKKIRKHVSKYKSMLLN